MAEHYTRSTTGVSAYCKRCRKDTWHRVDQGRLSSCQACVTKLDAEIAARRNAPKKPVQGDFWFPPAA